MLPPGDIRNCLVALSSSEPILADLFSYRFEDSILRGHSFGNLFLAVLTRLTGDFRHAVDRARDLLHVRGRVIPSTDTRVVLVASHPDGTRSTGEQCISRCRKPITRLELRPEPPPISEEIRNALAEADLVVVGPGSLFTSLIPNLLVPGMIAALEAVSGLVVVVTNLMTQPGETETFDLRHHLECLRTIGGLSRRDYALVNTGVIPEPVASRYRDDGAESLRIDADGGTCDGVPVLEADLVRLTDDGWCRHDPDRLAEVLGGLVAEARTRGGRGGS